eukprot:353154-Pyramimonas_sp.AAC.1
MGARPVVAEPQVAAAVGPPLCAVATLAPAVLSICSRRDLPSASSTRCAPMDVRLQRPSCTSFPSSLSRCVLPPSAGHSENSCLATSASSVR